MRILIVEDDLLIAVALADCLEREGHEVMGPAATAAEAIALCGAALPALALVDINLRDGSNGVILARSLVERWGLAVIFASGQQVEARQARDVALGHLCKPYDAETVLRCIEVAGDVRDGRQPRGSPPGFEAFFGAD